MELKNINSNGDYVAASNLNSFNFLILENCENWVQKHRSYVIFSEDAMIAQKVKFLILFISQLNIESTKTSHVDMDLIHKN
jgi:hypothetical protein